MGQSVLKRVTVLSRGRITLPIKMRRELGIDENTVLELMLRGDRIELHPVPEISGKPLLRSFEAMEIEAFHQEDRTDEAEISRLRRKVERLKRDLTKPRLFLDASVLILASAVEDGSSSLLLELCQLRKVTPLVSRLVLNEADQAVLQPELEASPERYQHLIEQLDPIVVTMPLPRLQAIEVLEGDFSVKDAHVVAGAKAGRASHLVTLNRSGFLTDQGRRSLHPIITCTPLEFLRDYFDRG